MSRPNYTSLAKEKCTADLQGLTVPQLRQKLKELTGIPPPPKIHKYALCELISGIIELRKHREPTPKRKSVNLPAEKSACYNESLKIFNNIANLTRANNAYRKTLNNITNLWKGGVLSKKTYELSVDYITSYNEKFEEFIRRVNEEGVFVEKSSSGSLPRKIVNANDWADAVLELRALSDLIIHYGNELSRLRPLTEDDVYEINTMCEEKFKLGEGCDLPCMLSESGDECNFSQNSGNKRLSGWFDWLSTK